MAAHSHPMLIAALSLADRGWAVFPCHRATKAPLVPGDPDPARPGKYLPDTGGVKKASTDEAVIRAWWRRWPEAMIGVAVGRDMGAFVVDVEHGLNKKTGEVFDQAETIARLAAECGGLPDTLTAITPSGGRHLYFRIPAGDDLKNWVRFMDGCDIRTTGGYVIAPPSVRADGLPYAWLNDVEIAEPTAEMLDAIPRLQREAKARRSAAKRQTREAAPAGSPPAAAIARSDMGERVRKYVDTALDGELRAIRAAPSGERNAQLNQSSFAIGRLVGGRYLDETTALDAIRAAAHDNPGRDDDRQLEATIASGFGDGKADPRSLADIETPAGRQARPRGAIGAALPARDAPSPGGEGSPFSWSPPDPLLPPDRAPLYPPTPSSTADGEPSSLAGGGAGQDESGVRGPKVDMSADARAERAASNELGALDLTCGLKPLTDLGNAERFVARYGDRFLFCEEHGWAEWTGKRWLWHHGDGVPASVEIACAETVRAIRREAWMVEATGYMPEFETDFRYKDQTSFERKPDNFYDAHVDRKVPDGPKAHLRLNRPAKWNAKGEVVAYLADMVAKWAVASESQQRLQAIWKIARSRLTVSAERFDADPLLFNVDNGTLAFEQVGDGCLEWVPILRPHRREDYISKISPVAWSPGAPCPTYDAFLGRVQPAEAMRDYLHEVSGLALTAVKIQKIFQNYGIGRNGKGTMVEVHAFIAGDYAATINIESLLNIGQARSGSGPSPDFAKLPGVRMLRVTEPEEASVLAIALVKRLTGGDPIDARHLNRPFFTYFPVFKLMFQGNYKLKIHGGDAGIWGRMRLVPWDVEIPEEDQDLDLPAKLRAEASGVLNHLVDGLLRFLNNGRRLSEPDEVKAWTAEYRDESDPVGVFLRTCTKPEPGWKEPCRHFANVYAAWARANGHVDKNGRPLSEKGLSPKLQVHKLRKAKSSGMFWIDVRLTRGVGDFLDERGDLRPSPDPGWEDEGGEG